MSKIIFMGTPTIAATILRTMVDAGVVFSHCISQPDRPQGRKRELIATPVKEVATLYNIPVLQPEKIGDIEGLLRELKPDLIITAAYGQLVPERILNIPHLGCVNIHASLLPKLRGGAPIHKAIIFGEKETGITIMYMAKKLDAGDMIAQSKIAIQKNETAGSLYDKLSILGAQLMLETLPSILLGTNLRTPQEDSTATYAPNISRDEERIDFSNSIEVVDRHIRGLNPIPGSFFETAYGPIKILEHYVYASNVEWCGRVINITKDELQISCSDGIVCITKLQPAGKKPQSIQQYIQIKEENRLTVGDKL